MWPKPNGNANVVFDLGPNYFKKKQKLNTCHEIIGKKKKIIKTNYPTTSPLDFNKTSLSMS